jgi:hypothetical protein
MNHCCSNSAVSLVFWTSWTAVTEVIILHEPRVTWMSETGAIDGYSKTFSVADRWFNSNISEVLYHNLCSAQTGSGSRRWDWDIFGIYISYPKLLPPPTHTHSNQHMHQSLSSKGYVAHKFSPSLTSLFQFKRTNTSFVLHIIAKRRILV